MNSQETALDNNSALGLTVTQQPTVYEWIKPEHLPPVGCPLVIKVAGRVLRAERTSHLSDKSGPMDYKLSDGKVIQGRYGWSYP